MLPKGRPKKKPAKSTRSVRSSSQSGDTESQSDGDHPTIGKVKVNKANSLDTDNSNQNHSAECLSKVEVKRNVVSKKGHEKSTERSNLNRSRNRFNEAEAESETIQFEEEDEAVTMQVTAGDDFSSDGELRSDEETEQQSADSDTENFQLQNSDDSENATSAAVKVIQK